MADKYSDSEIAVALLQYGSKAKAAKALGISPKTLNERIETPLFSEIYLGVKADVVRTFSASLTDMLNDAFTTINEVMNDKDINGATRLQAAQTVINTSLKFAEILTDTEFKLDRMKDHRKSAERYGYAL